MLVEPRYAREGERERMGMGRRRREEEEEMWYRGDITATADGRPSNLEF
jgi:hypothetical protein